MENRNRYKIEKPLILMLALSVSLIISGCSHNEGTPAESLPKGMQAAMVEVPKELLSKEPIQAGSLVDVIVEFKAEDIGDISGANSVSSTMFHNVKALAVSSSSKDVIVSLMLKPNQAEALADAKQKNGKFSVRLSN